MKQFSLLLLIVVFSATYSQINPGLWRSASKPDASYRFNSDGNFSVEQMGTVETATGLDTACYKDAGTFEATDSTLSFIPENSYVDNECDGQHEVSVEDVGSTQINRIITTGDTIYLMEKLNDSTDSVLDTLYWVGD